MMETLFEFLNNQSDGRLISYGIFTLMVIYYLMQGLTYIFQAIFSGSGGNKKSKKDE